MGKAKVQVVLHSNQDVVFYSSGISIQCSAQENFRFKNGFFANVGQAGLELGISSSPANSLDKSTELHYPNFPQLVFAEALEIGKNILKKSKGGFKLRIKIGNPSLRKLMSGAVAGAVSRTIVAPLETIRTHLMVGSCGNSTTEVFDAILKNDGWKGLFRGNLVTVIRVAPSKAIEADNNACSALADSSVLKGVLSADELSPTKNYFATNCLFRVGISEYLNLIKQD